LSKKWDLHLSIEDVDGLDAIIDHADGAVEGAHDVGRRLAVGRRQLCTLRTNGDQKLRGKKEAEKTRDEKLLGCQTVLFGPVVVSQLLSNHILSNGLKSEINKNRIGDSGLIFICYISNILTASTGAMSLHYIILNYFY
jgi:hypothetical protein